jgi:uncharacterized membrane protein YfcA
LLGIGGALVTIPVLHLTLPSLGIHASAVPASAVATALMAMVPMTLHGRVAPAVPRRHRHRWLRRMAGPIACGAAGGALLAAALNGPVLALPVRAAVVLLRHAPCCSTAALPTRTEASAGVWQRVARLPALARGAADGGVLRMRRAWAAARSSRRSCCASACRFAMRRGPRVP